MVKQSHSKVMPLPLTSRTFGFLPDGRPIEALTLFGCGGMVLEAITYGGTVTRLMVPDSEGQLVDVVLGFNNLDSYLICPAYMGAIVGRVAGRITGARFELDGKIYQLPQNDGMNHVHGGIEGFDKKIWIASSMHSLDGEPSLRLTYRSCDGEEGYPGNVDVTVTYTVTHSNSLLVETDAVTDSLTPLSSNAAGSLWLMSSPTVSSIQTACQTKMRRRLPISSPTKGIKPSETWGSSRLS
jgi:aldose 1-epimerase